MPLLGPRWKISLSFTLFADTRGKKTFHEWISLYPGLLQSLQIHVRNAGAFNNSVTLEYSYNIVSLFHIWIFYIIRAWNTWKINCNHEFTDTALTELKAIPASEPVVVPGQRKLTRKRTCGREGDDGHERQGIARFLVGLRRETEGQGHSCHSWCRWVLS